MQSSAIGSLSTKWYTLEKQLISESGTEIYILAPYDRIIKWNLKTLSNFHQGQKESVGKAWLFIAA